MRYIIEGKKKSAYYDNLKPWYLLVIVSLNMRHQKSSDLHQVKIRKEKVD